MSPALRAHLRLMESTPRERIHEHRRTFETNQQGRHYNGRIPESLIAEVKRRRDNGATDDQIRMQLRIGTRTLQRAKNILAGGHDPYR